MTRTASLIPLLAAALLLPAPPAAAQPVNEAIGTWRLSCATDRMTDRTACTLLHAQPAERSEPGRPSLALEIIDRGGRLVPAVTARDLTLDGASRGLLAITGTAQLRFPPNRLFEMPCGLEGRSLVCAPRGEDAARAEQELPPADRALIRVVGHRRRQQHVGAGGAAAGAAPARRWRASARLVPPGAAAPPEAPALDPRELLQRFRQLFN